MHRQHFGRTAAIILTLLVCVWAQKGDTPIVILDGSLSMESAVPWKDFRGSGDQRAHPKTDGAVTKVVVTVGGTDQTIDFSNQRCEVDFVYAGKHIRVTTGGNGKGLRITPFSAFQDGDTPNRLVHKQQDAKISHVTVSKAGVKTFDSDASGGTKIVISYQ